ncbi:MAG: hypothetical protein R2705_11820 [Ilumatobacteraceae bacterium]
MSAPGPLHARWLGRVPYREALALQHAVFEHGVGRQHLLLLEHPHVFTHGPRADLAKNVLVEPASVGAELVAVNRGGDVTYHGPGQLVGYPILSLAAKYGRGNTGLRRRCGLRPQRRAVVIDTLAEVGLTDAGRLREYPGCGSIRMVRRREDLRDRRAALAWPHHARVRAQPHHRHALPARLHHPLRDRRSPGDLAGRRRLRDLDAGRRRHRRPAGRRPLGGGRTRASRRRVEARAR